MKITAMLSFYNEAPELLYECVSRICALGVDHVVAVDGPYDLYPLKDENSPMECPKAIFNAVEDAGATWTWLTKSGWRSGNEVEKRNYMLSQALALSDEGDWLLVVDSDHMWEKKEDVLPSADLKGALELWELQASAALIHHDQPVVAQVAFTDEAPDVAKPYTASARLLLRAVPGMLYDGAHWRVRFPDGRVCYTLPQGDETEHVPILDLSEQFLVRHRVFHLPPERRERQGSYYSRRDAGEGIER